MTSLERMSFLVERTASVTAQSDAWMMVVMVSVLANSSFLFALSEL